MIAKKMIARKNTVVNVAVLLFVLSCSGAKAETINAPAIGAVNVSAEKAGSPTNVSGVGNEFGDVKKNDITQSLEELLRIRDPFKMPYVPVQEKTIKQPLEAYSVDSLKMVGFQSGPERVRAMILAPDSKKYIVSEKMKIGLRNGYIKKITSETIYVREQLTNILGRAEEFDTEIKLVPNSKLKKAQMQQPEQLQQTQKVQQRQRAQQGQGAVMPKPKEMQD